MPGEIIEIPEKFIKGYAPYVQVIETTKKEPERTTKSAKSDQELKVKKTTKKSGDK